MQRQILYTLLICCLFSVGISAQAIESIKNSSDVPVLRLPALDNDALLAEELAARAPGRAPHYAVPQSVDVSPVTGGVWKDQPNGTSVWRLRVQSPEAKSISFGFTEYWMPNKGELYIYAGNQKSPKLFGPFTPADNEVHNELWTQVIEGDDLVIEARVPTTEKANLRLRLTTVLHDFLGFGANQAFSGSCNLDVVCAAEDGWGIVDQYRDIIRSVAVYGTGNGTFCTGFLVNNARQDCTPYFMTANHCGISASNAPSLVTYWNFENSFCRQPNSASSGSNGDGRLNVFNSGAIWRASNPFSDMTIVELDDEVNPDANAFFAGWSNAMPEPGDTVIAIHHPATDEKRISFSFQQTYRVSGISSNPNANGGNIAVPDWDIGTTEGGSSGSPLFDRFKRVRGQLHGGGAACGNDSFDSYGYFHVSWEGGGTPSSRLKDWLDPDNTGVVSIDGKEQLSCQISVSTNAPSVITCSGTDVTYDLLVGGGFTENVTLSTNGLPSGAVATFSQNPVMPNTSVTLTVTYDGTVEGTNSFVVLSTDGTSNASTNLQFSVEPAAPAAPAVISPVDGSEDGSVFANLIWEATGDEYEYEFGTDASLATVLASGTTDQTSFIYGEQLEANNQYYWRVRASNSCGFGPWSSIYSFTAANVVCGAANTNNTVVDITDNSANGVTSAINVTGAGTIGLTTVDVEITHTYVGDLKIWLEGPNGVEVVLADRIGFPGSNFGCDGDNLSLTFSDVAANTADDLENTCGGGIPAVSGEFQPIDPLSAFNGLNLSGTWTLHVSDNAGQDVGSLESWGITFCGAVSGESDYTATVTSAPISTCANGTANVSIALGQSWGANVSVSVIVDGITLNDVTATQNGNTLDVTFSSFFTLLSGDYDVTLSLTAEDGTTQNVTAPMTIEPVPSIANPVSPVDGVETSDATIAFSWASAEHSTSYTFQISGDETFSSIDYSETTSGTSLTVDLEIEGLQYWRVIANNECGNATSASSSLVYNPSGVHNFANGRSLTVFPNPTNSRVFLDMKGEWTGDLNVNVMSISGRVLSTQRLAAGGRQALDISKLPAGTYLLDMRNGTERKVERLVVLP